MSLGCSPLQTCAIKCAVKMNLFYTLYLGGSTLGAGWITLEHPGSDTGFLLARVLPSHIWALWYYWKQNKPSLTFPMFSVFV